MVKGHSQKSRSLGVAQTTIKQFNNQQLTNVESKDFNTWIYFFPKVD